MFAYFANPTRFLRLARWVKPVAGSVALVLFVLGLYFALYASPEDFRQGHNVRLMYIHVPSAQAALGIYVVMTVCALSALLWRHRLADMAVRESAPLGFAFTFLCLATGSLWGKTGWGTWWVWDARLTSVLVLFFIYFSYMLLADLLKRAHRSSDLALLFVILGAVNLPIIRFSVDWWHTLHQPASLFRQGGVAIDNAMLRPLLLMSGAVFAFYLWALVSGLAASILENKIRQRRLRLGNGPEMFAPKRGV